MFEGGIDIMTRLTNVSRLAFDGRIGALIGLTLEELVGLNPYLWYVSTRVDEDGLVRRSILNFDMYLDPDDQGLSQELLHWGIHEEQSTYAFRDALQQLNQTVEDPVVLDVGANRGYFAFQEASILSSAKIHAIEPDPRNLVSLRKAIHANDFHNITVHQLAMGDEPGQQTLHISKHSNRHTLLTPSSNREHLYSGDTIEVDVNTIDGLVASLGLKPADIDVLRFDLEGYELNVIAGAERVLSESEKLLIFAELHPHRVGVAPTLELIDRLEEVGFDFNIAYSNNRTIRSFDQLRVHCSTESSGGAAEVLIQR